MKPDPEAMREKIAADVEAIRARGEEPVVVIDLDAEFPIRVMTKAEGRAYVDALKKRQALKEADERERIVKLLRSIKPR